MKKRTLTCLTEQRTLEETIEAKALDVWKHLEKVSIEKKYNYSC